MALSQRDIVITPNRGASTEPVIKFTGADASSSATITLRVINSSTVGTLSFEGTSGQLFSVTDSMIGTLFTVNDVSGIPSIEVLDTGLIKLAQYSGQVTISTATSISGAKLTVQGGVFVNGTVTATNFVGAFTGAVVGTTTNATNVGITNDTASGTAQYLTFVSGSSGNLPVKVAATSGLVYIPSTGNLGIGTTNPTNKLTVSDAGNRGLEISPTGGYSTLGGVDFLSYNRSTSNYIPMAFITNSGNNSLTILINGNVGISTIVPRSKFEVVNGTALIDDDPAGYAASFVGPTGANQYATVSIASNDAVAANVGGNLSFGGKYNSSVQNFANWASIKGLKTNATSGDYGGYLSFFTRLTGAGNLERLRITGNGGISFGATGTAVGTAGQVLQSNGDAAPTWVATSAITSGVATSAVNIRTIAQTANASYFPTFVNSNNAANAYELLYTTGTFVINPMTGFVGIGPTTPASSLQIIGLAQGQTTGAITDVGSMSGIITVADSNNQLAGGGGGIVFGSGATRFAAIKGYTTGGAASTVGDLMFSTRNATSDSALTERMRIMAGGNVGLGTTAPRSKLEVLSGTANTNADVPGAAAGFTGPMGSGQASTVSIDSNDAQAANTGGVLGFGGRYITGGTGYANWASIKGLKTNATSGDYGGYLSFWTRPTAGSNIERLRITASGNVGIGTTAPIAKFEVSGASGQLFSVVDSFVGTIFSVNDVSGIPSIEVLDTGLVKLAQYTGQVAISTSTAQSGFALTAWGNAYVNSSTYIVKSLGVGTGPSNTAGEIRASNEITAYYTSDERLKENVVLIGNPIEKLMQIRGVSFDWTEEHIKSKGGEDGYFVRKHDIGVIAQEIEKVLPEIVATRDNGYKAVKYEKIVPLLIECIKEQQTQINQILARLEMMNIK